MNYKELYLLQEKLIKAMNEQITIMKTRIEDQEEIIEMLKHLNKLNEDLRSTDRELHALQLTPSLN